VSALAITVGRGVKEAHGTERALADGDPVYALVEALNALESDEERWVCCAMFRDGHRAQGDLLSTIAITVDIDHNSDPKVTPEAPEIDVARLHAALRTRQIPGNVWYATPHGLRLFIVPTTPITDRAQLDRVVSGVIVAVGRSIEGLNFHIDPATRNPAQLYYAPRAFAKQKQRNATVIQMRVDAYDVEEFEKLAPTLVGDNETHGTSTATSLTAARAIAEFRAAYPIDFNRRRECPFCNHKGCFGPLPENPEKWFCHSSNHTAAHGGRLSKTGRGYHGDSLDIAMHETGQTMMQVLRDNGFLKDPNYDAFVAAFEAQSDIGDGRLFATVYASEVRYLVDRCVWLHWDGRRWDYAHVQRIESLAKELAEGMLRFACDLPRETKEQEEARKEAIGFAMRHHRVGGYKTMIEAAKSEPSLWAKANDFDRALHFLTVENGTIDLRTGELLPHDPAHMLTKMTPIAYDAATTCRRWERFLDEIFLGRADLIEYVHRAVGYTLTGETREQKFFLMFGAHGNNGKGRFVRQLMAVCGEYSLSVAFNVFTASRLDGGERNTPSLAVMAGARFVVAGEGRDGVTFDEPLMKSLTGQDTIQAMQKHEKPFSYTPAFKVWLHTNHRPIIDGTDGAIWRRPVVIPFDAEFKEGDPRRDPNLDAKLDAERAGILAWAVRGAVKWYREGLGTVASVKAATDAYRDEMDPVREFVRECCVDKRGARPSYDEVFNEYRAWCNAKCVDGLDDTRSFNAALRKHGKQSGSSNGLKVWKDFTARFETAERAPF
jgi:P4 family phage/plasmid primase-like protien